MQKIRAIIFTSLLCAVLEGQSYLEFDGNDTYGSTSIQSQFTTEEYEVAAAHAKAAYHPTEIVSKASWLPIRNQMDDAGRSGLVLNKDRNLLTFGTKERPEGFVSYNPESSRMTLAFHGTESLEDLGTDAFAFKSSAKDSLGLDGSVHQGIRNYYLGFRDDMFKSITTILDTLGKKEITKGDINFLFTGHSLGAAVATLAAYDFNKNGSQVMFGNDFRGTSKVVTFNSPRLFDDVAAAQFNAVVGEHNVLRFWRSGDPISMISVGSRLSCVVLPLLNYMGLNLGLLGNFAAKQFLDGLSGYKHVGISAKIDSDAEGFFGKYFSMQNHSMDKMRDAIYDPDRKVRVSLAHKGLVDRIKGAPQYVVDASIHSVRATYNWINEKQKALSNTVRLGLQKTKAMITGGVNTSKQRMADAFMETSKRVVGVFQQAKSWVSSWIWPSKSAEGASTQSLKGNVIKEEATTSSSLEVTQQKNTSGINVQERSKTKTNDAIASAQPKGWLSSIWGA